MADPNIYADDFHKWEHSMFMTEEAQRGNITFEQSRGRAEYEMLKYDLRFVALRAQRLGMFDGEQYYRLVSE
jgi:hypothetical protein